MPNPSSLTASSALALASLVLSAPLVAQPPPVHYQHRADHPPGFVGGQQLLRGGPREGYFQPVEIVAPEGTLLSPVTAGGFGEARKDTLLLGMLIGHVYRIKVGNIKFHEGEEVYPTIEVIDRLYPPPGQATRFPIPIELTAEELALALEGHYVTRVIYIEDPKTAMPVVETPRKQRYFEINQSDDPLQLADQLGRPVAILRMGSRIPDAAGAEGAFLYNSPPVIQFEAPVPKVDRQDGLEPRLQAPPQTGRKSYLFPRVR
ncbi:MAG TPA: hypothetical protein VFB96_16945 [Pirellulaceae bacterium]|jgi:hypothetical protein|nr:hypothetical protein [Pirellulaceae bacterium]